MHWSLDFYKADLERLEVGKKQNRKQTKSPKVPDYSTRVY